MNNENGGKTECSDDVVPPVEVIPVNIDADILNAIKKQIIAALPELEKEVGPIPVNVFIALPENRVILASSADDEGFVPGPDDKFMPQSLIPVSLFVGRGSNVAGYSVGSKTKYFKWD